MNIDRTLLYQLLDHDELMVARFLSIFKEQMPLQMFDLQKAIEQNDYETAAITAHGLKTQCRYVGLDELAQRFAQIEQFPGSAQVSEWIEQLEGEVREILTHLD